MSPDDIRVVVTVDDPQSNAEVIPMRRIALMLCLPTLGLAACSTTSPFGSGESAGPVATPAGSTDRTFVASYERVWQAAEQAADDLGLSQGYRDPAEGRMVVEGADDEDLRIDFTSQGRMTRVHARGESATFFLSQLQQNLAGYASAEGH